MSRRFKQQFVCQPLAELSRQLLFAPPEKRIEQVRRAEQLHDQLDPARNYPLEFISYRITGYRSENREATLLVGQAVLTDLRLLIDMLSRTAGIPVTAKDPAEPAAALAQRLGVSTKTITRWRHAGLRWRWVIDVPGPGGEPRIGFTPAAVEHFMKHQRQRVERAAHFTHMDAATRARLIERARRLALASGASPHQVARHLARRSGRAVETIRQLLEQHDRRNPEKRVFADHTAPLDPRQKRIIARAYRMGISVSRISGKFRRTRSTIYRAIHEQRAGVLRRLQINFVAAPTFTRPDADQVLLRAEPVELSVPESLDMDDLAGDLPDALRPLYCVPAMDDQRGLSLLVRYNYLKFKAASVRDGLGYEPRASDLDLIEQYLRQAERLRGQLVEAHQRVVLGVARQHAAGSGQHLLDLLELGHGVLLEAVELFDPHRAQSFESHLNWVLRRAFARCAAGQRPQAHRRESGAVIVQRMRDAAASFMVRSASER